MNDAIPKTPQPADTIDPNSVPNLVNDIQYIKDTIEYLGQNLYQLNNTLQYMASGAYLTDESDQIQQQPQVQLPDQSVISIIFISNRI